MKSFIYIVSLFFIFSLFLSGCGTTGNVVSKKLYSPSWQVRQKKSVDFTLDKNKSVRRFAIDVAMPKSFPGLSKTSYTHWLYIYVDTKQVKDSYINIKVLENNKSKVKYSFKRMHLTNKRKRIFKKSIHGPKYSYFSRNCSPAGALCSKRYIIVVERLAESKDKKIVGRLMSRPIVKGPFYCKSCTKSRFKRKKPVNMKISVKITEL